MRSDAVGQSPAIMAGDLNVAPLETDVWNHKVLLSVVSHTPVEVEKLGAVHAAGPWVDALRHFIPPEEKLYTWWSYRARNWRRSDRGRRLDHIWVSEGLKPHLKAAAALPGGICISKPIRKACVADADGPRRLRWLPNRHRRRQLTISPGLSFW